MKRLRFEILTATASGEGPLPSWVAVHVGKQVVGQKLETQVLTYETEVPDSFEIPSEKELADIALGLRVGQVGLPVVEIRVKEIHEIP